MSTPFIDETDLWKAEQNAMLGDTELHRTLAKCVSEIRRLAHELADPNYSYVGRIHRQSLISRTAEIERLRKENRELKEYIAHKMNEAEKK